MKSGYGATNTSKTYANTEDSGEFIIILIDCDSIDWTWN